MRGRRRCQSSREVGGAGLLHSLCPFHCFPKQWWTEQEEDEELVAVPPFPRGPEDMGGHCPAALSVSVDSNGERAEVVPWAVAGVGGQTQVWGMASQWPLLP